MWPGYEDHPKLQIIRYEHTLTSYRGDVGEDMWPGYEDHPKLQVIKIEGTSTH